MLVVRAGACAGAAVRHVLQRGASGAAAHAHTHAHAHAPPAFLDHRELGQRQRLFMQHPMTAGGVFFLPHGMRIMRRMTEFLRQQYRERGYEEVESPQLFPPELWKQSGHWEHYKSDMFGVVCGAHAHEHHEHGAQTAHAGGAHASAATELAHEELALKPMNCPAHCLIYQHEPRSYRQLPLRLAEFGSLHRNEARGALGGLTRLRRFHQDDAHIFCTPAQAPDEVVGCLRMIEHVYGVFHLPFEVRLATAPGHVLGSSEEWSAATNVLRGALDSVGWEFEVDAGGGAFYGPKIDFAVLDSHGRKHQCATVQLDFQLPKRFDLRFESEAQDASAASSARPVMIHRAVLGSLERFFAVIAEHFQGNWPMWLSPRQVTLCSVADRHVDAVREAARLLRAADVFVEVDTSAETIGKKVRAAELLRTNLVGVIGDREVADGSIALRARSGDRLEGVSAARLVELVRAQMANFD